MNKYVILMACIKTLRTAIASLYFTQKAHQWIRCLALLLAISTGINPNAFANNTILIYGDSLSAGYGIDINVGWVSLLQNKLLESGYNYQVVNASISGETTAGGRHRINEALKKHQPEIIIIELGGNDGLRGMELKQIKDNLSFMITASLNHDANVLLMSIEIPPNYGPRYNQKFSQNYDVLAHEHAISLAPFLLKSVATDPAYMQADGIHPKANAQGMILKNVWPFLMPLLNQSIGD